MSVEESVFAPEIEISGTGESSTTSLNVAVIVIVVPSLNWYEFSDVGLIEMVALNGFAPKDSTG